MLKIDDKIRSVNNRARDYKRNSNKFDWILYKDKSIVILSNIIFINIGNCYESLYK